MEVLPFFVAKVRLGELPQKEGLKTGFELTAKGGGFGLLVAERSSQRRPQTALGALLERV